MVSLLPVMAVLVSGCSQPVEKARYRIEVVVDTPSGEKKGSGVVALWEKKVVGPSGTNLVPMLQGQAIPVDFSNGRSVWMTIGHRGFNWPAGAPWLGERAFSPSSRNAMSAAMIPMLVTFSDEKSPTTARTVDPSNLSKSFGPGYALKGIYVSSTQEPVTEQASERLPWLRDLEGDLTGAKEGAVNTSDSDPVKFMSKSYFVREVRVQTSSTSIFPMIRRSSIWMS